MSKRLDGEGGLTQLGDGTWRATYMEGGRRRYLRGKTKKAAADRLQEALRRAARGPAAAPGATGRMPTLAEYAVPAIDRREALGLLAPRTARGYRSKMRARILPALGATKLDRITTPMVDAMLADMTAAGLAPGTVQSYKMALSAVLTEAKRQHLVDANRAQDGAVPAQSAPRIEPMTEAEALRVLAAAASLRQAARWRIALSLGLRQGEALGLRWEDIDLDAGRLTVAKAQTEKEWRHGCPDPEHCPAPARKDGRRTGARCPQRHSGGLDLKGPKSDAGRRTLLLPPVIVDELRAHRRAQLAERMLYGGSWTNSGRVFTQPSGRPIWPSIDRQEWSALLEAAGVRHYRLHDARHTAATMLKVRGLDDGTIMAFFGWNQRALIDRYAFVTEARMADARTAMDWAAR